jgi:hypothetical protein
MKQIFLLALLSISVKSQATISCNYQDNPLYTCALSIENPDGLQFENIPGDHLPGFNDSHVERVEAIFQITTNIPAVICRQFPNLIELDVRASQIDTINQQVSFQKKICAL